MPLKSRVGIGGFLPAGELAAVADGVAGGMVAQGGGGFQLGRAGGGAGPFQSNPLRGKAWKLGGGAGGKGWGAGFCPKGCGGGSGKAGERGAVRGGLG